MTFGDDARSLSLCHPFLTKMQCNCRKTKTKKIFSYCYCHGYRLLKVRRDLSAFKTIPGPYFLPPAPTCNSAASHLKLKKKKQVLLLPKCDSWPRHAWQFCHLPWCGPASPRALGVGFRSDYHTVPAATGGVS